MQLTLLHTSSDSLGYGRLGQQLAIALQDKGVEVNTNPDGDATNVICTVSYPSHLQRWRQGQMATCFTMWETDTLPRAFRDTMHAFSTIVVPSAQNVELFSEYHDNVKLVLLGIDPKRWHYRPRREPGQFFNFVIGGSGQRKGIDIALEAFKATFPMGSWGEGPIPRLIVKSPKHGDYYGDRVEQLNGRISSEEEVELYASAHAWLAPSRGEGFGLQPLQALAQGIPTILTNAHGHESFANLGYAVAADKVPAGYFMLAGDGGAGQWWEPSLDDMCSWMRHIYENYESCAEDMKVSAQLVARDFTWSACAESFIDALGRNHLSAPYVGDGSWLQPEGQRYLVMVNRPYRADIAGVHYQWEPGRRYYENADVSRILFEGAVLDPACLAEQTGFSPAEVERYSAAHAHCRECGTRLGTGVTRADEMAGV